MYSEANVSEETVASVFREGGIFCHTGGNRFFVMYRYTSIDVQGVASQNGNLNMYDTKNTERSFCIMKCRAQQQLQVFTAVRNF